MSSTHVCETRPQSEISLAEVSKVETRGAISSHVRGTPPQSDDDLSDFEILFPSTRIALPSPAATNTIINLPVVHNFVYTNYICFTFALKHPLRPFGLISPIYAPWPSFLHNPSVMKKAALWTHSTGKFSQTKLADFNARIFRL